NSRNLSSSCPAVSCSYRSYCYLRWPPMPCKLLVFLIQLDCHGRGREFESRRPRHSFSQLSLEALRRPPWRLFFALSSRNPLIKDASAPIVRARVVSAKSSLQEPRKRAPTASPYLHRGAPEFVPQNPRHQE